MARIRSIHPGIWTDEAFAAVSMAARVLYLGILTEADDHGIFEWKPISLKMRIFPADAVDIVALLSELIEVDKVTFIPGDEVKFGAVRNFCKFQRPKKPSYRFLLPDELRTYVGLSDESTEPVPHQFGTDAGLSGSSTEKSPQMEEEGGNRRKKEKKEDAAGYAFECGIIRLSKKHFDDWTAAYSCLDLRAELTAIAEWADKQGPRWFFAVANALNKRNRELKAKSLPRGSIADLSDDELMRRAIL